ncbi:MAG: hypothetical protein EXS58_02225 [Candidatus Latescibacteria bacterium]|nr:hypothetical protein [Candidatus Latescibacterota bacterium]
MRRWSEKILWVLLGMYTAACPIGAVDLWQVGTTGLTWESVGTPEALAINARTLLPSAVNSAQNALTDLRKRGGRIESPQSSEDLTTLLTDGNEDTFWKITRERRPDGTSMIIDLGAILPINRIRIPGDKDSFLRAYDLYVHDGNPDQLRDDRPIAYTTLIRTNLEQDTPVIEVEFPLQFVRFIRLISRSGQEFIISEAEVFGDGFAPSSRFASQVIDLGAAANFGRIDLATQTDSSTQVVLQTRTGTVPDPSIYYRKTVIFEGEDRAEEPILPVGDPASAEAYKKLVGADKGKIVDNIVEWSPWSAPYETVNGLLLSPGNRRYLQFRLLFSSQNARRGAVVESFAFEYSTPALGRELIAEVTPGTVVLGEEETFDYYIRSQFGPETPGFDRLEIKTPFKALLKGVELDGEVLPASAYTVVDDGDDSRLTIQLNGRRISTSGQVLRISFETLVTVYGTTFFAKVFDSQSSALGQDVIPGDASPAADSDRLSVHGALRSELVLDFRAVPAVFTPNGDGVNDQGTVTYILLRALHPVPLELTIYDLAGKVVRRLQRSSGLNGPQEIHWDGLDDHKNRVAPGLYLVRLSVDTDTGSETQTQLVGVVY